MSRATFSKRSFCLHRWVHRFESSPPAGAAVQQADKIRTLANGSLLIWDLDPEVDAGVYTCFTRENTSLREVRVNVKSRPLQVSNLTVIPHSVYALVTWTLKANGSRASGGYPIQNFVLTYSLIKSHLMEDELDVGRGGSSVGGAASPNENRKVDPRKMTTIGHSEKYES